MIERIYIHNYKGFVNFEMKCGPFVFLMGGNGSGKSSLLDVLYRLTALTREGDLATAFPSDTRFRFGDFPLQQFELDVRLDDGLYRYRLDVAERGERAIIHREELVDSDGTRLFQFAEGKLSLYNDAGKEGTNFPFDPRKGGLAIVEERRENTRLSRFKQWAATFNLLRLNPFGVRTSTETENSILRDDGSNFASWFEAAYQADTARLPDYYECLKKIIPGFRSLNWRPQYKAGKLVEVDFARNGKRQAFQLSELSSGELSLLVHYAVLHFGLHPHTSLALDEPDNFLSLSEVEPLLYAIEDEVERSRAQVFLVSHHPEFFDRWAKDPSRARYFERTDQGMFRLREIDWSRSPGLAPSEVLARGWQDA